MRTGILRSSRRLLEHAQAVFLGQTKIEHHGVVGLGVAEEMALLAVEGGIDRIARVAQRRHELSVEVRIVFHHEKPHPNALHAHMTLSPPKGDRLKRQR